MNVLKNTSTSCKTKNTFNSSINVDLNPINFSKAVQNLQEGDKTFPVQVLISNCFKVEKFEM